MKRTRIKICGLTRTVDVEAAVHAGADALGFVCYAGSPRYVDNARLRELARAVPPFVVPTLLFVNATQAEVLFALEALPNALLQFHGDESAAHCERFKRPYLRAVRVEQGVDLLDCERLFATAIALLADTAAAGFGGSGKVFDWSLLPPVGRRTKALILAGGLHPDNVGHAIRQVHPFAVDVSSGVEETKGVKSAEKISSFVAAVRRADESLNLA
ncbi:MAG TPA: phosphoribosylanthranilate isomerase [Burkholderiaceae bacterium]|nr:phosphoribosylanthranilate isomerase [Burkholderiaceae bacterium]